MIRSATSPARKGRKSAPRAGPRLSASARVAVRRLQHFTQLETADLAAVLTSSDTPVSAANLERDLTDAGRPLDAPLDARRAAWYCAVAFALWNGGEDAPLARVVRSALQARDERFPSEREFDRLRKTLEFTITCFDKRKPFAEWFRDVPFSSQFRSSDWPEHFTAGETIICRDPSTMSYLRSPVDGSDPISFQHTIEDFKHLRLRERKAARESFEELEKSWPQWTVGNSLPTYERDLFAIFMPSLQRRLIRDFLIALRAGAKEMLPIAIRERDVTIRKHAAALCCCEDAVCPEPLPSAIEALSACRQARLSAAALLRSVDPPRAREQQLSQGERALLSELIWKVEQLGTVLASPVERTEHLEPDPERPGKSRVVPGAFKTLARDLRARRMLEICFSA